MKERSFTLNDFLDHSQADLDDVSYNLHHDILLENSHFENQLALQKTAR